MNSALSVADIYSKSHFKRNRDERRIDQNSEMYFILKHCYGMTEIEMRIGPAR